MSLSADRALRMAPFSRLASAYITEKAISDDVTPPFLELYGRAPELKAWGADNFGALWARYSHTVGCPGGKFAEWKQPYICIDSELQKSPIDLRQVLREALRRGRGAWEDEKVFVIKGEPLFVYDPTRGYLHTKVLLSGALDKTDCLIPGASYAPLRLPSFDRQIDPRERFLPTQQLTDLVLAHTVKGLESNERAPWHAADSSDASPLQNVDYQQTIGERLEGLMANLAHDAALANEDVVRLSDGVRLDFQVCERLTFYFSLDPYNPRPVFDLVHKELLWFASVGERERTWGNISSDNGVLTLNVHEERIPPFSGLDQIDPEHWIVTE